jgi:hypothetical protein
MLQEVTSVCFIGLHIPTSSFKFTFTIASVSVQLLSTFLANAFRSQSSALERVTYFQNNLKILSTSAQTKLRDGEKPLCHSRDFLSPFLPLIVDIYFRAGYLPIKDIPESVRFFGALSAMAFIIAIVVPTHKLVGRKLMESHMAHYFVLAITYMVMLIFTAIYCHLLIQAVMVLRATIDA